MTKTEDLLHVAICQAVTSLNQGDEPRIAHAILRQALADYVDAAPSPSMSVQSTPIETEKRDYQRRLYDECIMAGWDSAQQNTFAEEIAHLHEELSEAFRAFRLHKDFATRQGESGKPEGVPIEFADVIIGLFYNAELHGFDLFAAIEEKHQFNLTRNYKAEGRQLHSVSAGLATTPIETGWRDAHTTIRELWPACSFQIREEDNAGFHKEPVKRFEIGIISTQYEVHGQRFEGATLAEALQKVCEFTEQYRASGKHFADRVPLPPPPEPEEQTKGD